LGQDENVNGQRQQYTDGEQDKNQRRPRSRE
jgi:hypothetical protein